MESSSTNTTNFLLTQNGKFEDLNKLEKNLERTYQAWESLIQGVSNTSDFGRFLRTFKENAHFFETEINNKEQCLTKYISQNDTELTENTERLENLQRQHFEKNETKQLAIIQQTHKIKLIRIRRTSLEQAETKLRKIYLKFCDKHFVTLDHLCDISLNLHQQQQQQENDVQSHGLTQETIQTFILFTADESHLGDQCSICMEDINVGRKMRRLTCDGQHYFCQKCIEGWLSEHNTCPLCRHKFD